MDYTALKLFHMTCAAVSGGFFFVRGAWMLADSSMLQRRPVRIVPHVVDTLLLASAVTLAVWSGQYPFVQSWLTAKVLALLAYIVLGAVALRRGRTKRARAVAFVLALGCFAYIVGTAFAKHPLFFPS